jgi:hypothetical protein
MMLLKDLVCPTETSSEQRYLGGLQLVSVHVYVHPRSAWTIFHNKLTRDVLTQFGIQFEDNPERATILIGSYERLIRELIEEFGSAKRYLLWTHEPRFWVSTEKWATIAGQKVRTMSMHSGEVYFDNYYYASIQTIPGFPRRNPRKQLNRTVAVVASGKTKGDPLIVSRADGVDLLEIRWSLAITGYCKGVADIYGKSWPEGISRGQSRWGMWALSKYKILKRYDFNLCFENSLVPYYCSEKIWQAIYCGCLPIYYGQDSIYQDFPPKSFIDYAELGDANALFDAVSRMSLDEFEQRYELCRGVFSRVFSRGHLARDHAARHAAMQIVALDVGRSLFPAALSD